MSERKTSLHDREITDEKIGALKFIDAVSRDRQGVSPSFCWNVVTPELLGLTAIS